MRSQLRSVLPLVCLGAASVSAAPAAQPFSWYHPEDSPITALFKRAAPNPSDPNFASNYPAAGTTPPTNSLPSAWTAKLASIQMPNVSVSVANNGYPTYAGGESGADQNICSFTYECTTSDDLVNPPDGVLALSFDDGPTDSSPELYDFLAKNNISDKATHFMIGSNIVSSATTMQSAVNAGGHIAVHTWSHPYMTTLTNEQVLGELGWTIQIISDLNGGRVPKYWRPPYGDVDNRVRAIAKGVFGLETVPWNQDSGDWAVATGTYTQQQVENSMNGWLTGSKHPGLLILEHELSNITVSVFMDSYPKMVSNGWNIQPVADAFGMDWYQNSAKGNQNPVTPMLIGAGSNGTATSSTSNAVISTSTSASSSTASSPTSSGLTSISPVSAVASATKTGGAFQSIKVPSMFITVLGLVVAML